MLRRCRLDWSLPVTCPRLAGFLSHLLWMDLSIQKDPPARNADSVMVFRFFAMRVYEHQGLSRWIDLA